MKTGLFFCLALLATPLSSALAEESGNNTVVEGQGDCAFNVGISKSWSHRFIERLVVNEADVANRNEVHYGLAWKYGKRFTLDFTVGHSYVREHVQGHHGLVLGMWKHAMLPHHFEVSVESLHYFDGGYRYEGLYALDWRIIGVHALNTGREAAAGFQLGTGTGLDPVRIYLRMSFGLTDGMPDRAGRFIVSFDLR